MTETLKIRLEAGNQTEDLAERILKEMPDDEIDEVEVERVFERNAETANEPITIGIVLSIAIGAEATVAAIKAIDSISEAIKAYIEYRTKKLEQNGAPDKPRETVNVLVLSGEAPKAISSIRGNQYLSVTVDRPKT
jgi:hypothetical protein